MINMEQGIKISLRILSFLLLFQSGITYSNAQSAGNIDTLSQWRVNSSGYESGVGYMTDIRTCFISGIQLIDSLEYYKIMRSGYKYFGTPPDHTVYHTYENEYHGLLREDGNKWYTHALSWPDGDVLLYDFNMLPGDTIQAYNTIEDDLVESIDYILINGVWKKKFNLISDDCAEYIIEGIGSQTGLFQYLCQMFYSELQCFGINGVSVWGLPTSECGLTFAIQDASYNENVFAFPNPFTSSISIELELNVRTNVQYTIYSSIGDVVFAGKEFLMPKGTHKFEWSSGSLQSGMYFAVIQTDYGVSVMKLVKL